jgi:hypothetical protein
MERGIPVVALGALPPAPIRSETLLPGVISLVSQKSRRLDKSAATLIAGSAGVVDAVVWVTCEGGGDWFDKSDERRLMTIAWDGVIDKSNQLMDNVVDKMSMNDSGVQRSSNQKVRLDHITSVLKEFRNAQRGMRVQSFSSGAEESMVGMVIDMLDTYREFHDMSEPHPKTYVGREPAMPYDDKIRRLSRMLRRIPVTRNHFSRTAGCILRYNLCLQEGSACTTRRLNQIQSDMIRSKAAWYRHVCANLDEIFVDINSIFMDDTNEYVFDWASHEMNKIDSEQFIIPSVIGEPIEPSPEKQTDENNERLDGSSSFYV